MTTTTTTTTRGTAAERALMAADIDAAIVRGFEQANAADRRAVADARARYREIRAGLGYSPSTTAALLTDGASQHKLGKGDRPAFGLMLTPARGIMSDAVAEIRRAFGIDGRAWNLCPLASEGCAAACLSRSGQSGMPDQQRAQAVRTAFLLGSPDAFGLILGAEIRAAVRRNGPVNLRLNTTSDIRWEIVAPRAFEILAAAGVVLYDYTAWRPEHRRASESYSLTYSAKEPAHTPDGYLTRVLMSGGNVAMPFDTRRGDALPESWNGFPVIDGDITDDRTTDPRGVVVGLRAKGYEWRRDDSGFIRQA